MTSQKLTTSVKTKLKLQTSAHIVQTMTLLAKNNMDILQEINQELESNIALEHVQENRCPTCSRRLPDSGICQFCIYKADKNDEPIVFLSSRKDFYSGRGSYVDEDMFSDENTFQQEEDLPTYILSQIAADLEVKLRPIAAHILTSLDDDGFFKTPIVELARYHHVLPSEISSVISLIQSCDPLGVGSPGPKEAMLFQVSEIQKNAYVDPLISSIIENYLDYVSKNKIDELANSLKISIPHTKKLIEFIVMNLNPYPARSNWGNNRHVSSNNLERYDQADVIISLSDSSDDPQLIVEIVWPLYGYLQVKHFKPMSDEDSKEFNKQMSVDADKANLFLKCLNQRNQALVQLMTVLANVQKEFILRGDKYLIPITRSEIAVALGFHEATISRAVSSKSVQLPSGKIVPLSIFFDRSLNVRTEIKKIISVEDKPLSDKKIVEKLEELGINIARRTVAKYRQKEGILPAYLRGNQES
jgi:RNA polymerase sigma-54 factor